MPKYLESMPMKHTWTFRPRLRSGAFGWKGSHLACQRLKEAVTEIKKVARVDPVTAGDGVVSLMERIWPAFQDIDTSSGALGGAVNWAQDELLPIAIEAPADRKTRDKWLDRLWKAIQEDGVDYLWIVQDRWGQLCTSREVASRWADQLLGLLRTAWSDPRPGNYLRGTSVCLSSLVAAARYQELFELLALERFPFWHHREFGMQALLSQGRMDEAWLPVTPWLKSTGGGDRRRLRTNPARCRSSGRGVREVCLDRERLLNWPCHVPRDQKEISQPRLEEGPC